MEGLGIGVARLVVIFLKVQVWSAGKAVKHDVKEFENETTNVIGIESGQAVPGRG